MYEKSKIICFDVETTGLDFERDEILSLSIVDGNGKVLFDRYIKPVNNTEWPDAEKIHHIPPEMVADEKTLMEYKDTIESIFANAQLIVGYNSNYFDIKMLSNAGINIGNAELYDVMLEFAPIYGEYNKDYGEYKWQKLSTCAAYYGYKQTGSYHDSLEDVRATLHCYNMIQEIELLYQHLKNLPEEVKDKLIDTGVFDRQVTAYSKDVELLLNRDTTSTRVAIEETTKRMNGLPEPGTLTSITDMIQELGKAGRNDLVDWFGDYNLYEKKLGLPDETIITAYREMKQFEMQQQEIDDIDELER